MIAALLTACVPSKASNTSATAVISTRDSAHRESATVGSDPSTSATTVAGEVVVPDSSLLPDGITPMVTDGSSIALTAASVASGGVDGVRAFAGAVRAMGIAIVDTPAELGVVVPSVQPSWGLGIEAGMIRALPELEAIGWRVESEDLMWLLVTAAGLPIDEHELWRSVLDDLRADTQSTDPRVRTWSNFVVEVGRNATPPTDVLALEAAEGASLTAVQTSLMLLRLGGDAATYSPSVGQSLVAMPAAFRRATAATGSLPCSMSSLEATILDASSAAAGIGFGKVLDAIAEAMPATERLGTFLAVANGALAFAKLIATALAFKSEIRLEGPPPLTRTKTTVAGENRRVKASFRFDVGNGQMLNCFRLIMNAGGLDFSLPSDGPIVGNKVDWSLTKGDKWVQLCSLGSTKDVCGGNGNPVRTVTDDSGASSTGAQGKPQRMKLRDDAKPVKRSASVRAEIAIKDPSLLQDLVDAVSAGASGVVGGTVVVTTEMAFRLRLWGATTTFEVRDWVDEAKWEVTIVGSQTATYDVSGSSTDDCHQTYHHWFTRQLAIDTAERQVLSVNPTELEDGFAAEISLHESFVLGDNGFEANGSWAGGECSDSASTPDLHCDVAVPGVLIVDDGMLSLEHGDGPRVSENFCEYEDLAVISTPIDVDQLLGTEAFTMHADAVNTRPLGPTDGALSFETGPVSVLTNWDITFTPKPDR